MNPSSIGLSVTVGIEVRAIEVTAEWGTYSAEKREVERKDGSTVEVSGWVRTQHVHTHTIEVTDSGTHDVNGDVEIQWLCRTLPDCGRRALSVFLVNRVRSENPGRPDDSEWLFQPRLLVCDPHGSVVFRSRSLDDVVNFDALDPDHRADELLFRDRPEYAVGHGCAADWDAEGGNGATKVRTVILPVHELARIDPRESTEPGFDMRRLGGTGPEGCAGRPTDRAVVATGRRVRRLGCRSREPGHWP